MIEFEYNDDADESGKREVIRGGRVGRGTYVDMSENREGLTMMKCWGLGVVKHIDIELKGMRRRGEWWE